MYDCDLVVIGGGAGGLVVARSAFWRQLWHAGSTCRLADGGQTVRVADRVAGDGPVA